MAEAGVADHAMVAWWALVAPTGTPAGVIARLAGEAARIGDSPDWQAALLRQGISAMPRGPTELAIFLRQETERWGAAVHASGATAD
jgi:tripartite-type tricarboxylate transporter receptor subunit TctC